MFTELTAQLKQKPHGTTVQRWSPPISLPGAIAQLCPWDRLTFYLLICQSLAEATEYRTLWNLIYV